MYIKQAEVYINKRVFISFYSNLIKNDFGGNYYKAGNVSITNIINTLKNLN